MGYLKINGVFKNKWGIYKVNRVFEKWMGDLDRGLAI